MSSSPSSDFIPMPDLNRRAEVAAPSPASARDDLARWAERLQVADSVEAVVGVMEQSLASCAGVGRGAIYVVQGSDEAVRMAFVQGPASADLSLPEIELAGMARRALREGRTVRQSGVAAGVLWAQLLRSDRGVEGVVTAVGEPADAEDLLAHAGLALGRERRRSAERREREAADVRAADLERAVEVLDAIVREGGTGTVLRRITTSVAGIRGVARARLWALRAEDGRYVEMIHTDPEAANAFVLPENAHRAEGFVAWCSTFPRWGGSPWIPAGTVHRTGPGHGDTLVQVLPSRDGAHPIGFLLVEIEQAIDEPKAVEDLQRWSTLARQALESRQERGRGFQDLEDLREQKEEMAELHRMKSQFIAAVSHELRTPLTSITAYAETLRSPNLEAGAETRDRFLRVIHDESRRLTRIVDDILDLATMDAGRVRMSCRRVDLRQVVDDALDVIRPFATDKKLTVETRVDHEAPVHADPDLLKQLAVNLLENATKFCGPEGNIVVSLETDATAVRLIVEDDGPGIPGDKLDAVFERFFQVDGSNARPHGGSGLGLAICRSIATWHDGRIWAESRQGHGARFVVSLPRVRATSRTRAVEPTVVDAPVEEHRVPELVIEMISEVMGAESVSMMLLEPGGNELFVQAALGLPDEAIREVRLAVGERIAGSVAQSGQSLLIPDLDEDARFPSVARGDQYRTRSLICSPVKLRGHVIGVLNVTNKISGDAFTDHDRLLLEILAQRVALVMSKLREFGDSRDDVSRMEDAMRGVIDVRRHYYPRGEGFSGLVLGICEELGLNPEEAAKIHYASMLRDVGMTRLPEGAYKKPLELTAQDREMIRKHPEEGARVLRSIEFLPDVFDMILAHHEEPDGSGYPRGLTDGGIPVGAKVLAVVDAYDALCTGRPYRPAVSREEALEEVKKHRGRQFDEQVVDALVKIVTKRNVQLPV